jgi:hypothetical protein
MFFITEDKEDNYYAVYMNNCDESDIGILKDNMCSRLVCTNEDCKDLIIDILKTGTSSSLKNIQMSSKLVIKLTITKDFFDIFLKNYATIVNEYLKLNPSKFVFIVKNLAESFENVKNNYNSFKNGTKIYLQLFLKIFSMGSIGIGFSGKLYRSVFESNGVTEYEQTDSIAVGKAGQEKNKGVINFTLNFNPMNLYNNWIFTNSSALFDKNFLHIIYVGSDPVQDNIDFENGNSSGKTLISFNFKPQNNFKTFFEDKQVFDIFQNICLYSYYAQKPLSELKFEKNIAQFVKFTDQKIPMYLSDIQVYNSSYRSKKYNSKEMLIDVVNKLNIESLLQSFDSKKINTDGTNAVIDFGNTVESYLSIIL